MTVKEDLHRLVDLVADEVDDLEEAIEDLHWLASEEPETLTDDEWAEVHEGEAAIARGESVTLDELRRDLGL